MKAWWNTLNTRERRLVLLAALLASLTALWLLVGKPLLAHRQSLQQDLEAARAIHGELQARRTEILSLRQGEGTAANSNTGSLHSGIIATLARFQLDGTGTRSEETDKNTVNLKLENKPFDALAQFLAAVTTEQAARITYMTLKPASRPGTVDAELTLQR